MIRTGRTTRLLDTMHPSDRRVLAGVVAIIVLATAVSRLSEWRPSSTAAVPIPPIILLATSYPTPSLPTPHPTMAPVVIVAQPTVSGIPENSDTMSPFIEPTATPLPPTAVPPTEAPAVEQAPAQQWVPDTAPVYSPGAAIDQTEQHITELPQEVAHPWAPDLPPPRSAGNGAQS